MRHRVGVVRTALAAAEAVAVAVGSGEVEVRERWVVLDPVRSHYLAERGFSRGVGTHRRDAAKVFRNREEASAALMIFWSHRASAFAQRIDTV